MHCLHIYHNMQFCGYVRFFFFQVANGVKHFSLLKKVVSNLSTYGYILKESLLLFNMKKKKKKKKKTIKQEMSCASFG